MFHVFNQESGICRFCGADECFGFSSPCPDKEEETKKVSRLCSCGSGEPWQHCQGNPDKETPWEFCG